MIDIKTDQRAAKERREAETKRLFKALRKEAEDGNRLAIEAIKFLELMIYGREGAADEI